jgi:PEP-CTERM motif
VHCSDRFRWRAVVMKLIVLSLALFQLATACSTARAGVVLVVNKLTHTQDYSIDGSAKDKDGNLLIYHASVHLSQTSPGNSVILGGPKGVEGTAGFEFQDGTKITEKSDTPPEKKTGSLDFTDPITTQTAYIYADAKNVSDVYSFFDFNAIGYAELLANEPFDFIGRRANGTPILELTGTSIDITDGSGRLLPQYQFTGPTEIVATVTGLAVPEPSTLVLISSGVLLAMICGWSRRQRRIENAPRSD